MNRFDWYFRLRSFEKSGKIYKLVGIRFFQKYSPTGRMPLIFSRLDQSLFIPSLEGTLRQYQLATRGLEEVHIYLAALMSMVALIVIGFAKFVGDAALGNNFYVPSIFFLLNVVGNFYPIFLQRYNRARIYRILEKRRLRKK